MNTNIGEILRYAQVSHRIRISRHAYLRARERLHWTGDTVLRMANRALELGLEPGNSTGSLKYCLLQKKNAEALSCPFLYGENIYVFTYNLTVDEFVLLTVYRAERALLRALANKTRKYGTNIGHGDN